MGRIGFRLNDDLKTQFIAYCENNSISISKVLINCIKKIVSTEKIVSTNEKTSEKIVSTKKSVRTKTKKHTEEPEVYIEQEDLPKTPGWADLDIDLDEGD